MLDGQINDGYVADWLAVWMDGGDERRMIGWERDEKDARRFMLWCKRCVCTEGRGLHMQAARAVGSRHLDGRRSMEAPAAEMPSPGEIRNQGVSHRPFPHPLHPTSKSPTSTPPPSSWGSDGGVSATQTEIKGN